MSEGKVEQWMEDFADDLFDGVQPDVDDCIKLLVKHAPSPSEATNYDICTIPTHHPNMQAEAYERGVRDAAKRVALIGASCPYASSSAKRLPIVAAFWHGVEQVKGTAADVILALLQVNPYRGT